MKNKNGFTLIELMVVITIIAVITAVGIVSYSASSLKSRDGRRMADIEKIRLALELYKQDKGVYPPATADNKANIPATYLQVWPSDPKPASYFYIYSVGGSYTYTLGAYMENLGSTNSPVFGNCGVLGTDRCNYKTNNP